MGIASRFSPVQQGVTTTRRVYIRGRDWYPLWRGMPRFRSLVEGACRSPFWRGTGLIIDAKGNYADFVREQCVLAGRLPDYYEVSLTSGVRWNIVGRPDLNAAALGGHIADMIENVQGTSLADPFWHQEAKGLASQVIRVLRLAQGREPTMASLYRAATSYVAFEEYVKLAEKRENTPEQHEELASIKFWLEAKAVSYTHLTLPTILRV